MKILLLIPLIPLLVVTKPADSRTDAAMLVPANGALFFQWTPSLVPANPLKPRLIYSHFLKSRELVFQTYYAGRYDWPAFKLVIGQGDLVLQTGHVPLVRGRTYTVLTFWRRLPGGLTEAAIYINGDLKAHGLFRLSRPPAWVQGVRIGARDLIPTEPSMGAPQHIDGQLNNFFFGTWSQ